MARKYEIGDVHAPVEDVDVPLSLKILVLMMLFIVTGAITLLAFVLERSGLLQLPAV